MAEPDLPAGDLSSWLATAERAVRGEAESSVPCDGCTSCCSSSQFVHVGPDETDTLAHIPPELRFPAPGLPAGHVVLGYDERGRCPMLGDAGCTIYDHRPIACRTYDCRVLTAAGVGLDGDGAVARRARRWVFDVGTDTARRQQAAIRAAASYLQAHAGELPGELSRAHPTRIAVLAVEAYRGFLTATPDTEHVRAVTVRRAAGGQPGGSAGGATGVDHSSSIAR